MMLRAAALMALLANAAIPQALPLGGIPIAAASVPSIRQAVQFDPGNGTTETQSVSVSFPEATLAGSTIVVIGMVSYDTAGKTFSASDSLSQTYTALDVAVNAGDSYQASFYVANSSALSTSNTVTFNTPTTSDYVAMVAIEVTGVGTSPLVAHGEAYPTSVASGGTVSSGNLAGGSSEVIVIGLATAQQDGNGSPHFYPNPGTGFTAFGNYWGFGAGSNSANLIYKVGSSFGTNPVTWTNAEGTAEDFAINAVIL
jgi:hypothetical protein